MTPSWIQGNSLTPPKRAGDSRSESGIGRSCPDLGAKLVGLCEGDERLIRLTPPEAFGEWDPNAILTLRESGLSGDIPLKDGMILRFEWVGGETPRGPAAMAQSSWQHKEASSGG